ncbi:MAG TPA: flagellar motor protein MotB, partial [Hyphomicrobiaceae bacterium]|nr:flagellar motor protein MotB [Hyphomicrobiaceae bacterium]
MSASDEETKVQELVIIRRPVSSEEAGHKGGVWKIAYADFMTAMMAFFLVMWLINASDKQTITQVAAYFNPVRLTDKVALSKGVHESEAVTQSTEKAAGNLKHPSGETKDDREKKHTPSKQQPGVGKGESKASGAKPKYTEEVLFRDPYGVLSKLASQAAEDHSQQAKGGEAYRDPFDPVFRRESQAGKRETAKQAAAPPAVQESAKQAATPPAAQESAKQAAAPPAVQESAKQAATPPAAQESAKQAAAPPAVQ